MEDKRFHLQIIQGVITRMATNSFLIKGWSITLISALFALAVDRANPYFVFVAYFPCGIFWLLDGYFLWQEKLYRALYDKVRTLSPKAIDYSMDTSTVAHSAPSLIETLFSQTMVVFHGAVLVSIIFVVSYL